MKRKFFSLEKKINKELMKTNDTLLSITAMGYLPIVTSAGGLVRENGHIVFSNGSTKLCYNKHTDSYMSYKQK